MNMMVWVKGSDLDYDGWQLPGWSWQDVAPVFARIEQGPMRIGRTPYPDELSKRFVSAARAAGVRADDDVSGPELEGAAIAPVTIHNGQRWSTPRGYLQRRNNLTILTKAEVHRVIIRNGRAVGVEYRRRGRVQQAFAHQEVIVSAGAYRTPHLLQLSGIGPADHLRGVDITPLVDSPRVGQGLTDHPHAWAIWSRAPGYVVCRTLRIQSGCCSGYLARRGKFANSIVEAVAHIRSTSDLPACDFQLMTALADATADPSAGKLKPALSIGHSYWTPKSRGSVLIRSSDPATPPAIRMNLLTEREDVEALIRALQRTREIMGTEPIASAIGRELLPGPGTDLHAHIRETAITTYHPSCTVAMGNEPDSPLDENLRVRGVDNLRVADASALPRIPRANTNAASIMIGERCADLLLSR
jgi:choline dehydrogenase